MAKPAARILFLEVVLGLAAVVVVARSFTVQILQNRIWHQKLLERRLTDREVRARRGRIADRNGNVLAVSAEQYRVSISLNEVQDTAPLMDALPGALGLPKSKVAAEFQKRYPYFNGPFSAEQVEMLRTVRGVHLAVLYDRIYPMRSLSDRVLGVLNDNGAGIEGMEKALDSLLRGRAGKERFLLDSKGVLVPEPGPPLVAPAPGRDVYLTLDNDLQGIVEGALRHAVETASAEGGDVVIMDIATGELLAVASLRRDSVTHDLISTASALLEPNQPGSTSKLFTVAALLKRGGNDTLPVQVDGRTWVQQIGRGTRTIHDEHELNGPVNLEMTVKYSSNIAISKFALRLPSEDQYTTMRDFGFGTAPAIGFPGESRGKLVPPAQWANPDYSRPSLGQGYEWEASAVQLAAGYGAIANHGTLMAPALVREVRDERGAVQWRHRPDTVRQAVPDSIAHVLMAYLSSATDSGGTGAKAQLNRFKVAGKTGTARVEAGGYRSSFAGIFPADQPQAVVYVMIDRARNGQIYGGDVAAPIVSSLLKEALALPRSPFDRSRLVAAVALTPVARVPRAELAPVYTIPVHAVPGPKPGGNVPVPAVGGLSVREAAVALERAGFAIRLAGLGRVRSSAPHAGDSLPRGSTVTLYADTLP